MPYFLFVPGGQRTGQDWDQVRARLETRGRLTEAITLSPPQTATLAGHIGEVLALMTELAPSPVILVGHSYASFVITGAAAQAPDRVAGLAYLDAAIPRSGQSLLGLFKAAGIDPAGFGVPDWPPFAERLVFDQTVIDRLPKSYLHCLKSEFLELTKDIPAWVAARPPQEGWRYHELDADHHGPIDRPDELAEMLLTDF